MFVGHFAVGFASKRFAPKTSLGALLAAPLLLDLLFPFFVLAGIEHVRFVPDAPTAFLRMDLTMIGWSHSLVTSLLWSALFAGAWFAATKDRRAAIVIAAGVFSHWILDVVTHSPDMPITPLGTTKIGLRLWDSTAATIVVELAMLAGGVWLYLQAAKPRRVSFAIFLVVLLGSYVASIVGPPPPSERAVGVMGVLLLLVVWWAARFDAPPVTARATSS